MRQTLFWIPETLDALGGMPMFGLGFLLIVWGVFSLALLAWLVRRQGWNDDTRSYLPILLIVGVGIVFVAPWLMEPKVGLPIRGYGVMVTLGVVCGVGLSARQARRMGLDPEVIFSLAFWMFVGGIGGARAFYIVQYWEQFQRESLWSTLAAIANFTKGGLVVYGSVLGGLAAWLAFCRVRKLPALAIGDLIAPGMLVGLALGRVGCLLNGCCYGGVCEVQGFPAITFPRLADEVVKKTSDPYAHQQKLGLLHDFQLDADALGQTVVADVRPDSPAGRSGLKVGQVIRRIELDPSSAVSAANWVDEFAGAELEIESSSGKQFIVPIAKRSDKTKAGERSPNVVGFELGRSEKDNRWEVESVTAGSPAERAGLKSGLAVKSIRLPPVSSVAAAREILYLHAQEEQTLETTDGTRLLIPLPPRSRPVHPTQIYSTMKASLIAFFLWSFYPFRRRDGEVFALMLMIYPLFRILLEVIRDDVPGLFGTPITISQAVSGVIFVVGFSLWVYLMRQPKGSALPPVESSAP